MTDLSKLTVEELAEKIAKALPNPSWAHRDLAELVRRAERYRGAAEGICPACGDGIDFEANGCCGACGWIPPEARAERYREALREIAKLCEAAPKDVKTPRLDAIRNIARAALEGG